MHFEFLTEDKSSKEAMSILIPKLLGNSVSYKIINYKGLGHIPKNMHPKTDPCKRKLLDQLPKILRGYGRSPNCGTVVIICDLDKRNKQEFLLELQGILNDCSPKPKTLFCLAIEEFEAWYLGDTNAIKKAYPLAKIGVLNNYINDSICGTWELLADAVYKGGHKILQKKAGWPLESRSQIGRKLSVLI